MNDVEQRARYWAGVVALAVTLLLATFTDTSTAYDPGADAPAVISARH